MYLSDGGENINISPSSNFRIINILNGNPSITFEGRTGNIVANGNFFANGEVTAYTTSDFRLKTAIQKLQNPFELIRNVDIYSFYWNEIAKELNVNKSDKIQYGTVAQQLANVRPEWVHGMYGDKYKGVDYVQMIPVLLACIQEQQKQIEQLQNR